MSTYSGLLLGISMLFIEGRVDAYVAWMIYIIGITVKRT